MRKSAGRSARAPEVLQDGSAIYTADQDERFCPHHRRLIAAHGVDEIGQDIGRFRIFADVDAVRSDCSDRTVSRMVQTLLLNCPRSQGAFRGLKLNGF